MQQVQVRENQTILDFTIQLYGDAGKVMDLIVANNLAGISSMLQAGQTLLVDATDNQIANYFQDRGTIISTGPIPSQYSPGGIGYMQITNGSASGVNNPFIVS